MELKLWFSFLLLHVIHVQSSPNEWLINVPKKILVLESSCVVIPCTYNIPKRHSLPYGIKRTGFWKNGNKVVATTLPNLKLHKEYKNRTQFMGNLEAHNCTMRLNGVKSTDVGPFYLRLELKRYKNFSYTKNPVYIDVISNPAPPSMTLKGKAEVTASCSVYYSCPTNPPKFSWSRSEIPIDQVNKENTWQWQMKSMLIFRPQSTTFNQTLNCTVRYNGGKQATSSMILPI